MFKGSVFLTDAAVNAFLKAPLSKAESMVLWWVISTLPPAGMVVSNKKLGETLKITRTRISQSMKRLCELGFIVRGPLMSGAYHYKVNPAFIRVVNS